MNVIDLFYMCTLCDVKNNYRAYQYEQRDQVYHVLNASDLSITQVS